MEQDFQSGDRVIHPQLGEGTVVSLGRKRTAVVRFGNTGSYTVPLTSLSLVVQAVVPKQSAREWLQDLTYSFESFRLDQLQYDTYQRLLSPGKVDNLTDKWVRAVAWPISVSVRADGTVWDIDGRHRATAALKVGEVLADCKVFRGLTRAQEALLFKIMNSDQTKPRPIDMFYAEIEAEIPEALDIVAILKDCKFRLVSRTDKSIDRPNTIGAIVSVQQLYRGYTLPGRTGGPDHLRDVLTLIQDTWPNTSGNGCKEILMGVSHMLLTRAIDRKTFARKLKRAQPLPLRPQAMAHHETLGKPMPECMAMLFEKYYNFSLRVNKLA